MKYLKEVNYSSGSIVFIPVLLEEIKGKTDKLLFNKIEMHAIEILEVKQRIFSNKKFNLISLISYL
jgi:hypothetical protein